MGLVLRPVVLYFALLVAMRLTGKRSLGEVTPFDFVLLLIVSETVSNAIVGPDHSITAAVVAFTTLLIVDVFFSLLTRNVKWLATVVEEEPVMLLHDGKLFQHRLKMERIEPDEILEAARQLHGLERFDQIKVAILERGGHISIIPK